MQATMFTRAGHVNRSAEISECGRYRWWLRREWNNWNKDGTIGPTKGVCCFIMLNPSTADGLQDDQTVRRCISFAKEWGYDTLSVRNLFPFRATYPKDIPKDHLEATGGHRGDIELTTALTTDLVIVAWGTKTPMERDKEALRLFHETAPSKPLHCLRKSLTSGKPWHPLYVAGGTVPILFQ